MVALEVKRQLINPLTALNHLIRVTMSHFPRKERNQRMFRSVVVLVPAQHSRDVLDSDSLNNKLAASIVPVTGCKGEAYC